MKPSELLFLITCLGPAADAVAVSEQESTNIRYSKFPTHETRDTSEAHNLWRRKGGGRSGSTGRVGRTSNGGRSSSTSSGGGGGGGSGASTSRTSNTGGASFGGSGPRPAYGGGTAYAGGAKTPYQSGNRLGNRGGAAVPLLFVGATALAFWPFVYPHGAYIYPYGNPYRYYNESSRRNETREVLCGCKQYEVCSCDDENNGTVKDLVGNGSYDQLNKSVVNVAEVNGSQKILIDGSLPNGTTAEDPSLSAAANLLLLHAGWWPVVATVVAMVL